MSFDESNGEVIVQLQILDHEEIIENVITGARRGSLMSRNRVSDQIPLNMNQTKSVFDGFTNENHLKKPEMSNYMFEES